MNLLHETIGRLGEHCKGTKDVLWVGSDDGSYAITWDEFAAIANVEYDDGYGAPYVATDLVIVGSDWWLNRYEYDGAESWVFRRQPVKRDVTRSFRRVTGRAWGTLEDLENPITYYEGV